MAAGCCCCRHDQSSYFVPKLATRGRMVTRWCHPSSMPGQLHLPSPFSPPGPLWPAGSFGLCHPSSPQGPLGLPSPFGCPDNSACRVCRWRHLPYKCDLLRSADHRLKAHLVTDLGNLGGGQHECPLATDLGSLDWGRHERHLTTNLEGRLMRVGG